MKLNGKDVLEVIDKYAICRGDFQFLITTLDGERLTGKDTMKAARIWILKKIGDKS